MKAWAYRQLRRHLDQSTRTRIKTAILRFRRRLAPLYRLRYGAFGASELKGDAAAHLPDEFEILMVHCSYNDLLPLFTGTVPSLLTALMEICGPTRTLAMPAFTFGGAEHDLAARYRRNPRFDARRQPSEAGLLSELFRRSPGVRRSLHPSHSICALGPHAEELTSRHHRCPTVFGEGTPFGVMARRKTVILGIGTYFFRCLTQVHAAEDILGPAFPLARRFVELPVTLSDGISEPVVYPLRFEPQPRPRRLEVLRTLLPPGELLEWRFHGVPMFRTSAGAVTEGLMEAARRGVTIYGAAPSRPLHPTG